MDETVSSLMKRRFSCPFMFTILAAQGRGRRGERRSNSRQHRVYLDCICTPRRYALGFNKYDRQWHNTETNSIRSRLFFPMLHYQDPLHTTSLPVCPIYQFPEARLATKKAAASQEEQYDDRNIPPPPLPPPLPPQCCHHFPSHIRQENYP